MNAQADYYVSTCPETGRQFLCEVGKDNNIAELTPKLVAKLRKKTRVDA